MEKQKRPIQKWQLTMRWLCFVIWSVISATKPFSIWNCSAALCFFLSALLSTKQYLKEQWEGTP